MTPAVHALLGLALWAASLAWLRPSLLVALLLVGPFVVVPLVLAMVGPPRPSWRPGWTVLLWAHPAAALAVTASFSLAEGLKAAAFTLPWLGFTGIVALGGLARFFAHRARPLAEVAVDAGLGFLAVGGIWLTVSRSGYEVLGFGNPIALLTVAHFNLAGIAVPVLAGFAARRMPGRLASLVCVGAITGLPAVAAGITLQAQGLGLVNVVGVAYFVGAMLLLATLHARLAWGSGPAAARLLWALSATALPVGMALAMLYAAAEVTGVAVSIETMTRTHAVINVFGFALPALAAWWIVMRAEAQDASRERASAAAIL